MKPSTSQRETLAKMAADDGTIVRVPGGFWTTRSGAADLTAGGYPRWYTVLQSVRAMERRGWVVRRNVYTETYRDDRAITDAGRQAIGLEPTGEDETQQLAAEVEWLLN
jgi:hypothetical protein